MTEEEILKIANKDGFATRFKLHREFLKENLCLLQVLRMGWEEARRNNNTEDFNHFIKLGDKVEEDLKNEEQEFMATYGETLKQLEAWAEANPK